MFSFIIRRLFSLIPILLGISFLMFLLMALTPGDFLTPIKAQRDVSEAYITSLEQQFGLNEPFYVQYFYWLGNALQFDLGYSWTYKVPVVELLGSRIFATFLLAICTVIFAWSISIVLGVLAAIKKGGLFDRVTSILAYGALSIPEFFLGLIAVYFAARTGWFPVGGLGSVDHDFLPYFERVLDTARHLFLPTIVLGIGYIGYIMRIMRSSFIDVMHSEFVKTARAKGLSERVVMFKHVFRNAVNPLISIFGMSFSYLLSGSLIVEIVMSYPGLGDLIYQALIREDQFVVLGAILMSCTILVISNLLSDILLAFSDPRIRLGGKQ